MLKLRLRIPIFNDSQNCERCVSRYGSIQAALDVYGIHVTICRAKNLLAVKILCKIAYTTIFGLPLFSMVYTVQLVHLFDYRDERGPGNTELKRTTVAF